MGPTPTCSRIVTRALPFAALGLVGIVFVAAGGPRYLTLAALAQHREALLGLLRRAGPAF